MKPTQPSHGAENYVSLLWRHIYERVLDVVFPHHREHEPGGNDPVKLPFGFISDIIIATPITGQTILYNASTKSWNNSDIGDIAVPHGAYLYVQMPGTTTPPTVAPGPKNISGRNKTITAVTAKSDGAVAATFTGGSCNFGAGGNETDITGLTTAWNTGNRLTVTITSCGADATYFIIDWNFL